LDYKMLTKALGDRSGRVRRRALELAPRLPASEIAGSRRVELAEQAAGLLGDKECAEIAAFAVGELGVTAPAIVAALAAQASDHPDPLCRESAVAALGALGTGLDAVLAATGDIAVVRRRAVIALAAFDGPAVTRALKQALNDRDWQVRQAAEDLVDPDP
jgi:HEAT repeat protein